jgi:hypothetical protein
VKTTTNSIQSWELSWDYTDCTWNVVSRRQCTSWPLSSMRATIKESSNISMQGAMRLFTTSARCCSPTDVCQTAVVPTSVLIQPFRVQPAGPPFPDAPFFASFRRDYHRPLERYGSWKNVKLLSRVL